MKTRTYHISNFGSFAPSGVDCVNGYVTIHYSDRYSSATVEQLNTWTTSRLSAVRGALLGFLLSALLSQLGLIQGFGPSNN